MNNMGKIELTPRDEYNDKLLSQVHPEDWQNPEPKDKYNLVVIGAGTAGLVTAAGAAGLGAKVALVEKHMMGGDCLNMGCVPSKALIRAARAWADVINVKEFGINVPGNISINFNAVMDRMRRLRAQVSPNDSVWKFKNLGVDVFLGQGHFSGNHTVEVRDKTLRFKKAVITTGARAAVPPIEGLKEAGYLTNETVFSLVDLPKKLVVIGGGPIGCELSQAFRRFGSEVTLIEMDPQFLVREDPDAAAILEKVFEKEGVQLLLNTNVKKVSVSNNMKMVHVETNGISKVIPADEILVGVGRVPNIQGLSLEKVGVETDKRQGIIVNDKLQTTNPNIYAAGDVCMRYKFTHAADAAARIVIQNTLFLGRKKLSALTIPWCTYTDPEIAHVGLYTKDAVSMGIEIDTFTRHFREVDRAILDGETLGFVKVHTRKGSDEIQGATIVARHAGDMISEFTTAMSGKMGLKSLSTVIHPYPTQADAIKQVADEYNRSRLTPFLKKLFKWWLSWTR